ncbi:hypothetical protein PBY51_016992 [Eleginops maclovinus]|uniref:C-type lectin domain-containing protein n=1 Tax=Eleginops maclovinus TaxID=56733 RepID=A0AAN7WVC3_ELEMC|nr:hypothetical protein PBY51_016992 [Eleginops maclovinus]
MDRTFIFALLLLSLSATLCKYVYIQQQKTWNEALDYCRQFHTDLAPVSSNHDNNRLMKLANYSSDFKWIGLKRDPINAGKWTWSGGAAVSKFFWAQGQPDHVSQTHGLISNYQWHDIAADKKLYFFCYRVVVVRERKTWQEALEYCREHHRDLASITSDTEMLLIQRELQKHGSTERVWTGLRFFPGGWLWVDKKKLSYQAWGQEGQPECPEVKLHCAALQGTTFSLHASAGTVHTNGTGSYGVNIAADVKEGVWAALDCAESLHFICY